MLLSSFRLVVSTLLAYGCSGGHILDKYCTYADECMSLQHDDSAHHQMHVSSFIARIHLSGQDRRGFLAHPYLCRAQR